MFVFVCRVRRFEAENPPFSSQYLERPQCELRGQHWIHTSSPRRPQWTQVKQWQQPGSQQWSTVLTCCCTPGDNEAIDCLLVEACVLITAALTCGAFCCVLLARWWRRCCAMRPPPTWPTTRAATRSTWPPGRETSTSSSCSFTKARRTPNSTSRWGHRHRLDNL